MRVFDLLEEGLAALQPDLDRPSAAGGSRH